MTGLQWIVGVMSVVCLGILIWGAWKADREAKKISKGKSEDEAV